MVELIPMQSGRNAAIDAASRLLAPNLLNRIVFAKQGVRRLTDKSAPTGNYNETTSAKMLLASTNQAVLKIQ